MLDMSILVSAQCARSTKPFLIRFQEAGNRWLADWVVCNASLTAIEPKSVQGTFDLRPDYPGCPHCSAKAIFRCGCEQIACWNSQSEDVCPGCKQTINIKPTGIKSMKVSSNN